MLRAILLLCLTGAAIGQTPTRLLFSRLGPEKIGLFIADVDGGHERALLRPDSLDYNASFSADGKWIVFTSERSGSADIYRIHPDGDGLERLTDYQGFDDQAALSPDGSTLAFVSTREGGFANIWLLDLAARQYRPLAKTNAGSFRPSWSPDGKWIVFTSDRETQRAHWDGGWEWIQSLAIYVVRSDGTSLRRLTPIDGYAGSPKWSSDGRRLIFYQSTPKDVYPGRTGTARGPFAVSQVASVDVESGAVKVLTTGSSLKVAPQLVDDQVFYWNPIGPGKGLVLGQVKTVRGNMKSPSWSADGRMVVYHKSIESRPARMLPVQSLDPSFSLFRTGFFPAWSPRGDRVILAETPGLLLMDVSKESITDIYPSKGIYDSKGLQLARAEWSPDGSMIAFGVGAAFANHAVEAQIAIMKPDGNGFRTITNEHANAAFPSWSPDGKRIVYRVAGAEQGLRIVNLEDGKITKLTSGYDDFPGWWPKGDLIAFTSFRDGDFEIYTIRPDGTGIKRLTQDHGNNAHGAWSADGEWYIFSSGRMGWKDEAMLLSGDQPYADLFAMRSDGTDLHQLTDNQWEEGLPAAQPKPK
jgi:Tol biopolymer transport system component